ncbi:MAG: HIT family protein [Acidimicrobiales bacterium]
MPYVTAGEPSPSPAPACVFCEILASGERDEATHVLWRGDRAAVVLNAYPYAPGHVMAMPLRHVASFEDLGPSESQELWQAVVSSVAAIRSAYRPGGLNVGANLGRPAGAGIPGHLHMHVLPRWAGDTNFMTTVAETRVLPEPLDVSWRRLRAAWGTRDA